MRPRTTFAMLLAVGAVMHLVLAFRPPLSVGYLTLYLCWLVPSAAFAWSFWTRSSATPSLSVRGRRMRQPASSRLWMEGLGVFLLIASVGLVIHILGPFKAYRPSIGAAQWTQRSAMGLMFALSAAGCWALLRGAPGDTTAPIPDGSRVVRAGGWVRRLAGIGLACWGAWLLVLGIRDWGASAGIDRMMNLVFVVGGPLVIVVGLALALRRGRSGV